MVFHWLYWYLTFESLNKIMKTWVLCEAKVYNTTTLSITEEFGARFRAASP